MLLRRNLRAVIAFGGGEPLVIPANHTTEHHERLDIQPTTKGFLGEFPGKVLQETPFSQPILGRIGALIDKRADLLKDFKTEVWRRDSYCDVVSPHRGEEPANLVEVSALSDSGTAQWGWRALRPREVKTG